MSRKGRAGFILTLGLGLMGGIDGIERTRKAHQRQQEHGYRERMHQRNARYSPSRRGKGRGIR